MPPSGLAILIGAGPTTGAGIARILSSPTYGNMAVALLSRTGDANLASTIGKSCHGGEGLLQAFKTDTSEASLTATFDSIRKWKGELDSKFSTDLKLRLSVFNVKHSHKTAFEEETAARFTESLTVYATGAMVFSQLSLKWMMSQYTTKKSTATTTSETGTSSASSTTTKDEKPEDNDDDDDDDDNKFLQKKGTLIFTSTLGSLRTNAGYAAYGATRASVRMLAQSLAREYSARGVHVVHAVANGGITDKGNDNDPKSEDAEKVARGERIKAESVGRLYLGLEEQGVDLWVHELDMRPAAEKF